MGNMRFKVGDRVRIKSIDWFNENKDRFGRIDTGYAIFSPEMAEHCGRIVTISFVYKNYYDIMEDSEHWYWTDEMIEGLVEEENKSNIIEEAKTYWDSTKDAWICLEGYIFKDENGNEILTRKIILEKKKKEYPNTFLGCCDAMGIEDTISRGVKGYKSNLLDTFQKLLICRDAYWKIAGDEIGLGKPWEPDWKNGCYVIFNNGNGLIEKDIQFDINAILAFPTAEMRDAFYENFKKEIEICKELL
jgi:hypothetical protein